MILDVGKICKGHFSFMKKMFIFEYDDHAVVLEKEKGVVTCYATNAACSEIFCMIPLGEHSIKSKQFVAICYSQDVMLIDGGDLFIMLDFGKKKVAVNLPGFQAIGKKAWGEDVQIPWKKRYNVLFGLDGEMDMDLNAAKEFWAWFEERQDDIAEQTGQGGEEAENMKDKIGRRLSRVFPYEKESEIEFQVGNSEGKNTLFVYHFNKEQLKEDAQELGAMMPQTLREDWMYITEA